MLTPEELEKLSGAESLFPSPIPVQYVSSVAAICVVAVAMLSR